MSLLNVALTSEPGVPGEAILVFLLNVALTSEPDSRGGDLFLTRMDPLLQLIQLGFILKVFLKEEGIFKSILQDFPGGPMVRILLPMQRAWA